MARLTPDERARQRQQHASQFLADVSRFIPADKQAAWAELKPVLEGHPDAVAYIDDTVLRRQEGSRLAQTVSEQQRQLDARKTTYDEWWRENETAARVGDLAMRQGLWDPATGRFRSSRSAEDDDPGGGDPQPPERRQSTPAATRPNGNYVTREELAVLENGAIALTSDLTRIGLSHFREFNESLDTEDLIAFAQDRRLPLTAAYDAYVGERRASKRDADTEARINAAREEGRQEALRTASPTPYPYPGAANPNPMLAQINQKPSAEYGVQAAVAEFNSLQAKSGG